MHSLPSSTSNYLQGLLRPYVSVDEYLRQILAREAVFSGLLGPLGAAHAALGPALTCWANGNPVSITPSGSFAKGTANRSGTDLDLFLSIPPHVNTPIGEAYRSLANQLRARGFAPKLQNVSIGVEVGALSIDLVPGRLQHSSASDHTIFHRRTGSWRKTNIATHIAHVCASGRLDEIRLLKIWRDQNSLEFPSFYLELATIRALNGCGWDLENNVRTVMEYLGKKFLTARFVDPANTANVLSDDLTMAQKLRVQTLAKRTLGNPWKNFVR